MLDDWPVLHRIQFAAAVASVLLFLMGIGEVEYRNTHRHAPGPSLVIAIGFFAASVIGMCVYLLAQHLDRLTDRYYGHMTEHHPHNY